MSKRNPAPTPPPLTGEILSHRRGFERFVLEHAEPWHREHLGRLFTNWRTWNGEHFESRLEPPYLLLAEPSTPRRYGDCGPLSGFGGRSQIRIRPSLVRGSHPHVEPGGGFQAGRDRFVDDILLHEMIHQWQFEVLGDGEPAYCGHGPLFRDVANQIGAVLGLSPVRDCKRRGSDRDLPNCAYWPHAVRPRGYYLGAYVHPSKDVRAVGDLERIEQIVARYLHRRREQHDGFDVLADTAVVNVLEAVAEGIGTVTGEPRTFNAALAARLLHGGEEVAELPEVRK
jgi:hypothetical protein